jgi:hypothetical protein
MQRPAISSTQELTALFLIADSLNTFIVNLSQQEGRSGGISGRDLLPIMANTRLQCKMAAQSCDRNGIGVGGHMPKADIDHDTESKIGDAPRPQVVNAWCQTRGASPTPFFCFFIQFQNLMINATRPDM